MTGWLLRALLSGGWAPAGVFLGHLAAMRLGAYARYEGFDRPVHVAGGAAIAWFFLRACAEARRAGILGNPATAVETLLIFALTTTAAVVWEFAEYVSDRWMGTRLQGGLPDTLTDLALGMAGGAALLALRSAASWPRDRRRR
ncbi:MAG TPA: hypothetical protein VJV23_16045 [Candidatus Polarisedimenticolia bacterium]|nr:hypothetical protein [Candidatus Polarisedimenticolia bacterium]